MSDDRCTFVIPGDPVGKGRPRATTIGGGRPRLYTPPKTVDFERCVRLVAAGAWMPRPPIEGAVRLDILAVFRRPKRLMRKRDPTGLVYCPTARVDLDNCIKSIGDGIQSCGLVFANDSQICLVRAVKAYAEIGGVPRSIVSVSPLRPLEGMDEWMFRMCESERTSQISV